MADTIIVALKNRDLSWRNLFELCGQLGCSNLPLRFQELLLNKAYDTEVR